MELNHHQLELLNEQYRMHPEMSLYPNTAFYGNQLRDGVTAAERLRAPADIPRSRRFAFDADDSARVLGWDGWRPDADDADGSSDGFAISLPSFSGCLMMPAAAAGGSSTRRVGPLLRYPLRLGPARRVRLRPSARTTCGADVSAALRCVLGGPVACPCVQVDGVRVVAGLPTEED